MNECLKLGSAERRLNVVLWVTLAAAADDHDVEQTGRIWSRSVSHSAVL